MKTLVSGMDEPRYWNHIASFGKAKLVTDADGHTALLGGSRDERAEAQEWISLFLHDVVLQKSPTAGGELLPRPCRRRGVPRTSPHTFWSGCRSAVRRLAVLLP